jgi:magnesium transporter
MPLRRACVRKVPNDLVGCARPASFEELHVTIRAFFYDAEGHDREIELDEVNVEAIGEQVLLWIDIEGSEPEECARVAKLLQMESARPLACQFDEGAAVIESFGDHISVALALPSEGGHSSRSDAPLTQTQEREFLTFVISDGWLVTSHAGEAPLLEQFREKDKAETLIGALSPASLAAALIDWHLGLFFDGASGIADEVDALDERVLRDKANRSLLGRIVALRRKTARLRSTLIANRPVFYGLSRPDVAIITQSDSTGHYTVLAARFERALDEIERVRDLVNGSFELFASRSSLQTNTLVKALTVITAVLGYYGAVAGLFGMNLKSSLFNGGDGTFAIIVGTVTVTSILAITFARTRKWL